MNDLIFLDTETTGLEYQQHEIWEIAWAINNGPIEERILVHSLKTADPKALALNGYYARYPEGARAKGPMTDLEVRNVLAGNTIVAANPTFDRIFMYLRWGYEPYLYRSVDVESMAVAVFNYDRPKGLASISEDLRDKGYPMPDPDHSAGRDVEVVRAAYIALKQYAQAGKIY